MTLRQILAGFLSVAILTGLLIGCGNSQNSISAPISSDIGPSAATSLPAQTPELIMAATPQSEKDVYNLFQDILMKNQEAIILAETDGKYEVSPASIEKTVVIDDVNNDDTPELIFISGTGDPYHPYQLNIYNNQGQLVPVTHDVWGVVNSSLFSTENDTLCILELQSDTNGVFEITCIEYSLINDQLERKSQLSHKVSLQDDSELFTQDGAAITREDYRKAVLTYITNMKQLLIDQGFESSGVWWQKNAEKYIYEFDDFSYNLWLAIYIDGSVALPYETAVDRLAQYFKILK